MVAGLLVAFGAASCGGDGPPSGEVVLYTSMPDPVVDRLKGVIEERFPDMDGHLWVTLGDGITLTVVRGRTADLEARIAAELDSGGIQADLIWLAEPSPYERYKAMGLLAPLQPPAEAPIPSLHIDPDGFYVAGRLISMVVAWNPSLLPEGLADWPDLQRVERTAFPEPDSGAARATIKALTDRYGEEFFATLAGRGGVSVPSNGAARDGVVAGVHEAVGVLDYMAREAKAGGADIDFAYPLSGTVLIPSPIAMTASAANPGAAEAVVDFLLSEPGQKIMVEIGSFYPVRTDVAAPVGAPPMSSIPVLDVDWTTLGSEVEAIRAFWESLYGASAGAG
jgi:iron(III) transport system substrate-binding protein